MSMGEMPLLVLILLAWGLVTVTVVALCRMATHGDRAMRRPADEPSLDVRHASRVRRVPSRARAAVSRRTH
jgi:hypothetical protein